jgi:hypothetical protein
MGNWRFGLNSNGRKYRKTGRRVERKMAEGKEDGGFCGGVDGNSREWVKVFGREAFLLPSHGLAHRRVQ